MPCDSIRRGDIVAQQARKRALDGLAKRLSRARVEAEATDALTGETAFRAITDDGFILAGRVDAAGELQALTIEGWTLAERAGWCDECSLAALRGGPELARIAREAAAGGAGIAAYGSDALLIGGRR